MPKLSFSPDFTADDEVSQAIDRDLLSDRTRVREELIGDVN